MNYLKRKAIVWMVQGIFKDGPNLRKWIAKREAIKMLEGIRTQLAGKKTYVVAVGAIIGTVVAWVNGAVTTEQMIQHVTEAVLAVTLRAGINKAGETK